MFDLTRFELSLFEESAARAASLMRLLGNERRLMILCQLLEGELSVGELQPRIGLSQSALSQHLALLREEGAVSTRRDGQVIYYRVADPAVLRVLETLADLFCPPEARTNCHDCPDHLSFSRRCEGAARCGTGRPYRHPRTR